MCHAIDFHAQALFPSQFLPSNLDSLPPVYHYTRLEGPGALLTRTTSHSSVTTSPGKVRQMRIDRVRRRARGIAGLGSIKARHASVAE